MSAVGAADEHGDEDSDDADTEGEPPDENGWCDPCIDRLAGYTALADDDEDDWPAQPDHVVDMHIQPVHVLFEQTPIAETEVDPGESRGGEEDDFPDFYFDPVGLRVEPGAVVDFSNMSAGLHTVTAFTPRFDEPPYLELPQRIPEESPPFSSPPIAAAENWLYRFDEPGVYDVLCLPHFDLGMVARVVVADEDDATLEESEGSEDLPVAVQTVFDAPEMGVESIFDAETVAWEDLTIEDQLDPGTLFEEE